MSEELKKMSAFELFAQAQLTYAEAEEKAKQEAGSPKVERFRIGEDGEYSIRVLPLAPSFDEQGNVLPMKRKGYEYPIHQLFIGIEAPQKKGGKKKTINIPVIRTTDAEIKLSADLIDTYVKIAKEMYGDDEELIKLITGNSFSGGLRWNYQHAIMILDVSSEKERAKGPQLWQCSHSLYKDIDDAKMRLWRDLREDGEQETCPISGFTNAYPVKVIRKNNNGKTEYATEIGRKTVDVKEEEVNKLLELPRIPEQIFRYTRYQFEATLVFLQQYDEKHDMEVCKEADFIDTVKKIEGELPADDTSHFDINGASGKDNGKDEVTIDSLWNEYDAITDQDLSEKSDEYQELREKIRQFIEDNELDVRISRTKNNQQLLEEIEEAMDDKKRAPKPAKEEEPEPEEPAPKPRRASRPKAEPEPEPEQEDEPEEPEDEAEDEPEPVRETRRRPRPSSDETPEPESENDDEEKPEEEQGAPRRHLHSRRLR